LAQTLRIGQAAEQLRVPFGDVERAAYRRSSHTAELPFGRVVVVAADQRLVYRVDRLSRSLRGLVDILDQLDDAEVGFRSATEPVDTSTAVGRMLVQMLGVFAPFERETIIDRVVNGMERKAARGEWPGGYRPHGYQLDRTTGKLAVVEAEAPVPPMIFDLCVNERLGARAIGVRLNERGLRTKAGKPWNTEAVLTVLRNRVYLGEVYFRGTWYRAENHHPPLVTPTCSSRSNRSSSHAATTTPNAPTSTPTTPSPGASPATTAASTTSARRRPARCTGTATTPATPASGTDPKPARPNGSRPTRSSKPSSTRPCRPASAPTSSTKPSAPSPPPSKRCATPTKPNSPPSTASNQRAAERFLALTEADVEQGRWIAPAAGRTTVAEWAEQWFASASGSWKPKTRYTYRSVLDRLVLAHLGDRTLAALRPITVASWVGKLGETLSASQVRQAYRLLAQVMASAVDNGMIPTSPCRRVRLPRIPEADPRILTVAGRPDRLALRTRRPAARASARLRRPPHR
jgi:hypothetical protein